MSTEHKRYVMLYKFIKSNYVAKATKNIPGDYEKKFFKTKINAKDFLKGLKTKSNKKTGGWVGSSVFE